jgi:phosphoenolpyruvate synthase/pyruvate phosphate dikinase
MHTINPVTGNRDELLVELAVGLGQTLASAEHPGSPYRLVGNKLTGEVRMLAFANFSEAIFPDAQEGTVTRTLDYSGIAFSTNASYRESLGKRLTTVGKIVEETLGAPQDIEGVLAGETLYLVQSRPQQGVF